MITRRKFQADFRKLPVNICVITFSSVHDPEHDHFPIIRRCLESIVENTSPEKYRLHIGCNNLSPRALAFVDTLVESHHAIKYIGEARQDHNGRVVYPKYPLMRRMYQATAGRPSTPEAADWIIWFDDDSYVTENDWLERLEDRINTSPRIHQFGKLSGVLLRPHEVKWAREFSWFNPAVGIPLANRPGGGQQPGYNFIEGGFYALSRHAIDACSIPDPRLFHNGGDWTTSLALMHKGMRVGRFTYGVEVDAAPRRGMHADEWTALDDPALADKPWIT